MSIKKLISGFLAFLFIFGAVISVLPEKVAAAYEDRVDEKGKPIINYYNHVYSSPEDKLKAMTKFKTQNGYSLFVDEYTGEVAFKDEETGDAIFSNPYDVGAASNIADAAGGPSNSVKEQLLSQILLTYKTNTTSGKSTMFSFTKASVSGQITVKNIKNGLRMEYAIGDINVTRLVPMRIPKERFEELILDHITDENYKERLLSFYTLYDSNDVTKTETQVKEMQAKFPITRRMAIYVCSPDVRENPQQLKDLESIIKTFCSQFYTLDDMEQDHSDTDYNGVDIAPPCFRMALEYIIEEDGLSVRLPANGIRFDESIYQLCDISVLPYMGCGNIFKSGYTFIPDGSGAIIKYEDIEPGSNTILGSMFGEDYAYITMQNDAYHHEQPMRYPVFGNVNETGGTTADGKKEMNGFVAIIAEGDSMASIVSQNEGLKHNYASVFARFTPRPYDEFSLAETVEGASKATYPIVSKRKYSGSYVIKYKLLTSKEKADGSGYDPSYVGMAKAYRDYLVKEGILTKKTSSDGDVPLYLETFGSIKAMSQFLTFPISVDKALTTFEDVIKIYDELSEDGVTNVNFKLTGYSNGGLKPTYPAKVSWVSALGGNGGFGKLRDYASEKGFGIYPDFDFAYAAREEIFDGFNPKSDAVRTIDSRYTSRKYYDSASQSLENDYAVAVSPSRYRHFADKFTSSYSKYDLNSVSASTLGTTLNSDFDKNDPYNREDAKKFTCELLATLKDKYQSVMTDGGNAYALPFVDHIIGVNTDSSNYLTASQSVPFVGFVLHGYVDFSGEPLNMQGDVERALLKAIENGASINFTVAYENVSELKEDENFNKYYSVDFEIWKDEIVQYYKTLNEALSDLSDSLLMTHDFVSAQRVPTEDEMKSDEKAREEEQAKKDKEAEEIAAKEEQKKIIAERMGVPYTPPRSSGSSRVPDYKANASDGTVYSTNSKYSAPAGTVVKETYDDGTRMYINYNAFDIVITDKSEGETFMVPALGFIKK